MTRRTVRLVSDYIGSQQVAVYRPGSKHAHFTISGAEARLLDPDKVAAYMYGCDWTDRGSPGWITPDLRCDEFLRGGGP